MSHRHPPIAIVGMASLFPKAPSLAAYWRNILDAADCISDVPANHSWDPAEHLVRWDAPVDDGTDILSADWPLLFY